MSENNLWQLVVRSQERDVSAVKELFLETVEKYYIFLKTVLGKDNNIKDILNDCYVNFFSEIDNTDILNFSSLLDASTAEKLKDYLVKKKKVSFQPSSKSPTNNKFSLSQQKKSFDIFISSDSLNSEDYLDDVINILNQIPSVQRYFMFLYFYFNLPLNKITEITGATEKEIVIYLSSAYEKINSFLSKINADKPELHDVTPFGLIVYTINQNHNSLCNDINFREIQSSVVAELQKKNFFGLVFSEELNIDTKVQNTAVVEEAPDFDKVPDSALTDMGTVKTRVPFAEKSLIKKILIIVLCILLVSPFIFYGFLVGRSYLKIKNSQISDTNKYIFSDSDKNNKNETIVTKGKKTTAPTTAPTTKAPVTLNGIVIGSPTIKTYSIGQPLKFTLIGQFSDGSVKKITTGYSVIGDTSTAGSQNILISYQGKTTSFKIEVKRSIKKISISSAVSKTIYTAGESLDTSGLKLLVTYNDNTTDTVATGFTCTPMIMTNVGTQKITVSYGNQSVSFKVTVKPKETTTKPTTTAPPTTTEPSTTKPTTTEPTTTKPPETSSTTKSTTKKIEIVVTRQQNDN